MACVSVLIITLWFVFKTGFVAGLPTWLYYIGLKMMTETGFTEHQTFIMAWALGLTFYIAMLISNNTMNTDKVKKEFFNYAYPICIALNILFAIYIFS